MNNREISLPRVTFYYRKSRTVGNYSVEFIFKDVADRLNKYIAAKAAVSFYESKGLLKRIYNSVEAVFRQGDVNHITGDVNFIGILLQKRKTIQTILDCGHLESSKGFKHAVIKFFWLYLPVKRCRYVTAISSATKNEILKYVSCDPDKIVIVPVAISEKFKKFDKPFNKQNTRILQIGTAPNKNILRLIEAVKGLSCTLVIIGKHQSIYEEKMKEYRIPYSYSWGLSEDEMMKQYQQADIIALASTYEGFGMQILEGQAVGRPVLTSKLSSMPEVAGDAACLVDPYDVSAIRMGLNKIIEDDTYRNKIIESGFENVKKFDPQKIAMSYYDLYMKTLNFKLCSESQFS
jgi:glycosyltransferase involved in cell wall biosynthesis